MNQTLVIPYVSYLSIDSGQATYDIRLVPVSDEFIPQLEKAFQRDGIEVTWQQIFDWSRGRKESQWFIEQVFRILYREAHDADRCYAEIQRVAEAFRKEERDT